jgi:hypothetical protein
VIRLERDRHFDPPTAIFSDRPVTEEEAAEALATWHELVASGRASITGTALCLLGPELTEAEWIEECATGGYGRA